MPLLNANSKLVVVLVLVIVLLAFFVGFILALPLAAITLDVKTHTDAQMAFTGYGMNAEGELLDATHYVTSWSTTGLSEKIVPKGGVTRSFGAFTSLIEYRYRVYLSHDGLTWSEMSQSPYLYGAPQVNLYPESAPLALDSPTISLAGPYSGGIKANLEFHIKDVLTLFDRGWFNAASDQAYLIPGVGKINAPAQAQVGDTISVSTVVGYVRSELSPGKGWQFWGYSLAQKKYVVGPVELTDLQQSFTYKLVSADFSVSSGCSTPNRIEWHLLNELWEKDFTFTTTIDVSTFAPSFTFSGYTGDPVAGGSVVVSFDYASNPTTKFPVQKVVIAYGYGGIGNEQNLTNGTKTLAVPLGQGGNLHFEGYAVDSACRPSPAARLDVNVREPGQPNIGVKPNWLVFAVVLVLVAAVGVAIAYFAKGVPVWARALLLVFFLVLGLLLAVVMVPAVLDPTAYAVLRGWSG